MYNAGCGLRRRGQSLGEGLVEKNSSPLDKFSQSGRERIFAEFLLFALVAGADGQL